MFWATETNTFRDVKRIVVKIGTSSLTHPSGKLNIGQMEKLTRQIADLRNEGREVVLVSSGAIGAGLSKLGLTSKPKTIPLKQAVAAVGQGMLMHIYEKLFGEYGLIVAQVLLTRDDVVDRKRYLNARHTLLTLLTLGVVPIINENDTVAVEGIRFGDNDTLSALVAGLVDADLLVILSDVEGLYSADPRIDPDAQLIPLVESLDPSIEQAAGGAGTTLGTGGMATKIKAARIAVQSGVPMLIAHSGQPGVLRKILAGEKIGTLFVPETKRLTSRKHWIAFAKKAAGTVVIDDGACRAIVSYGGSLLPSGVVEVQGKFSEGDLIEIRDRNGKLVASGLTNFSSRELALIKGRQSSEIEEILGSHNYDEVVHRDNLVVLGSC